MLVENWMRARQFELRRQIARLGQPVDRSEWRMGAYAVNAYYDGAKNEDVLRAWTIIGHYRW